MAKSIYDYKPALLSKFLELAVFEGLSLRSLLRAGKDLQLSEGEIAIIAPDGALSMVDYWFAQADEFMLAAISSRQSLKIREKATLAVRSRLEFFANNKEAYRKAVSLLALPQNSLRALAIGQRFANLAWRSFGDKSTDFNYYTKRAMLLAVDVSCGAYFLGDESDEHIQTWQFLDRRIENIMQIEKTKWEAKKIIAKLPNPIPYLAKLRYGQKPLP
jgi:ubiquinone biosynthesis protein COQ9